MRAVVLWDVGGTLVFRAMPEDEFVARCLAAAGISLESLTPGAVRAARELRQRQEPQWRTIDDEHAGNLEIATVLLRGSGATQEQIRAVAGALTRYFGMFALVPGIRQLLEELEDRGVVQGVVSNWPPSLEAFLDFYALTRYFRVVVGSGAFGAEKPDPSIFRCALEQLGVAASDCVYVGDNPEKDIIPARKLGMEAIHFDPGGRWTGARVRDVEGLRSRLWGILGGEPAR